ncbi:FMN-binding protein [Frankia sp. AgPm24]|uniref:FMN-binding protein n=1 Tax=Frankia sp. AgPm24 TaxID=631128 RepID=UPI00200FE640|nr:FMN-binding protein [Frankia sp. AgPm24]MCK9922748.1 FMN-binding protein [Frankia sp. AgPm24]
MNDRTGRPYRARLGFAAMLSTVVLVVGGKAATGSGGRPAALGAASLAEVGTTATATPSPTASSGTATTRTVLGDAINTRFGAVQVKVVLTGTKIVDVVTVQVPDRERRDVEINDQAVPILKQEVLSVQSARIDSVSGASYTSYGYAWSVQSALDKAGV